MNLRMKVTASANEKRRFIGQANITPMVELVSDMLDDVMFAVAMKRLAVLKAENPALAHDQQSADDLSSSDDAGPSHDASPVLDPPPAHGLGRRSGD